VCARQLLYTYFLIVSKQLRADPSSSGRFRSFSVRRPHEFTARKQRTQTGTVYNGMFHLFLFHIRLRLYRLETTRPHDRNDRRTDVGESRCRLPIAESSEVGPSEGRRACRFGDDESRSARRPRVRAARRT